MRQATIIGLLLGYISVDSVEAHRLRQMVEVEDDFDRPFDAELTEYDSPFGMDSQHGYGGKEQSKVENNIDVGVGSSDEGEDDEAEADVENAEQDAADFEPSKKQLEAANKKFGVQSLAQGQAYKAKKHKKKGKKAQKALAEVEEGEAGSTNQKVDAVATQAAEKAKAAAQKAQEEAEQLKKQAMEA